MQFARVFKGLAFLATSSLVLSAILPVRDDAVTLPVVRDTDSAEVASRASDGVYNHAIHVVDTLPSRGTYQGLLCTKDGIPGQDWAFVNVNSGIQNAIDALRWESPDPNLAIGPGWGNCEQIACVNSEAILWCNDNSNSILVDRFTLADMALDIVNSCWENFEGTGQLVTGGQLFSSDDYNIIVRLDPCQAGPRKREKFMAPLVKARENEAAHPAPREFQSRGTYQGLNCIKDGIPGQDWQWVDATSGDIGQAIASIEWAGNFVIGAGWGYCGQIACHGTSAIYWCNDNNFAISVDSHILAQMAQYIVDNCYEQIPYWHTFSGGQLFNSDDYNIIVRAGECDGAPGRTLSSRAVKREDLMAELESRKPAAPVEIARDEFASRADAGIPIDLQCSGQLGWETVDYEATMWGEIYLSEPNRPFDIGPMSCEQVFCFSGSGLFVCNPDQFATIEVWSSDVANLVLTIANGCHVGSNTGGQVLDDSGYWVQVRSC